MKNSCVSQFKRLRYITLAGMEFILVRHALPLREENTSSVADPRLSPTGQAQAERLADWLSYEQIDHIISSPKRRAQETAAPLASRLNLEVEIVPEFSEMDRSSINYIPVEDVIKEKSEMYEMLKNRQWDSLGYMEPEAFQKEVVGAFKQLQERMSQPDKPNQPDKPKQPGLTTVIVAHGGTLNALVSTFVGSKDIFFADLYYTSISRLKNSPWSNTLRVATINETAHLYATRTIPEPIAQTT